VKSSLCGIFFFWGGGGGGGRGNSAGMFYNILEKYATKFKFRYLSLASKVGLTGVVPHTLTLQFPGFSWST
jgi:hypothetical protein